MKRRDRLDEADLPDHHVHLVGLEVADHIEADAFHLRMPVERFELAAKLLGAVLCKDAVPCLPGLSDLVRPDRLRDSSERDLCIRSSGTLERFICDLQDAGSPLFEKLQIGFFVFHTSTPLKRLYQDARYASAPWRPQCPPSAR